MSCRWYCRRLGAYVDEELPPRRREAVVRHLEGCSACRHEVVRLQALAPILQDLALPDLPERLAARILANAAEHVARRGKRRILPFRVRPALEPWGMRAAAAAVLLLGIALGSMLGQHTWAYPDSASLSGSASADVAAVYALDAFDAAPSGSLEAGFLLAVRANEGGR